MILERNFNFSGIHGTDVFYESSPLKSIDAMLAIASGVPTSLLQEIDHEDGQISVKGYYSKCEREAFSNHRVLPLISILSTNGHHFGFSTIACFLSTKHLAAMIALPAASQRPFGNNMRESIKKKQGITPGKCANSSLWSFGVQSTMVFLRFPVFCLFLTAPTEWFESSSVNGVDEPRLMSVHDRMTLESRCIFMFFCIS